MRAREIKEALQNKRFVFGTMIRESRSPAIARIMAEAGFDYILIDMEHSVYTLETAADICQQARACDLCTVVRVPCLEGGWVSRLLDAGADGIMCPMVETPEKARTLVELSKYAPLGNRGLGTRIGHTDFKNPAAGEVMDIKNRETILIAQIESTLGIKNLDGIVSTKGIDIALVGPVDLSLSMGIPGDLKNPELLANIDQVIEAAARANIASGIHTGNLDFLKDCIRKGMTFIAFSTDINLLIEGGQIRPGKKNKGDRMNQPCEKYLKLGIIHFMIYPETIRGEGPILETLRRLATDPDFQAVEIGWIKSDELRRQVRDLLSLTHLTIAYGAQPRLLTQKLNLNDFDQPARKAAVEDIKKAIEEAAFLKAGGVAVLSGKAPDPDRRTEAKETLTESLKELCDYAGERNLKLTLETFDAVPYGKNCLIGPTREAAQIAQKVNKPNFGLLIDLSHLPLLNESAEQMIREAGPYLSHVHIGNCVKKNSQHPAYGDEHPRFGIPDGENDVPQLTEFLRQLFKFGYLGKSDNRPIVSFEVKPQPGEPSEVLIADSKRVFRQAWADLVIDPA